MAELEVIYDAGKELAAIIHIDEQRALPLAMVGPTAGDVLQAFIDATPFDITIMDGFTMRAAFLSFLGATVPPEQIPADTDRQPPLEPPRDRGMEGAAQAEREAHEVAGEPPDPAPADTDLEADARPETVTVRCWNCDGKGVLVFGDGQPDQTCNMCRGSGKVTTEAIA